MRFLPIAILVLLVPLGLTHIFRGSEAAATPGSSTDLMTAVPGESLLVVTTDEWDAVRNRSSQNAWTRFLGDERFASAFALLPIGEIVDETDEGRWPSLREVAGAIHGRTALFVSAEGPEQFGFGLLVESDPSDAALRDVFGRFGRAMESSEETELVTRDKYQGIEMVSFEGAGSDEETLVAFSCSSLFGVVVGSDLESARATASGVIDRHHGVEPASSGFGARSHSRGHLDHEPVLSMHVDVQGLLAASRSSWGEDVDAELLSRIGLTEIDWVEAYADLGSGEELDFRLDMHLPSDVLLGDLADLFGPLPTGLVKRMPSDSVGVGLFNYDVAGAFDVLADFLQEHYPEAYEQYQFGMQMGAAQLGVDIETELLGQLTGQFGSFTIPVPADEISPMLTPFAAPGSKSQGGAFMIGLRDSTPIETLVERLIVMAQAGGDVRELELAGVGVKSISFGGVMEILWAFTDDALLISSYPSAMEAALTCLSQPDGSSAADVEAFAEQLEKFRAGSSGSGASMVSLAKTRDSVETMLGALEMLTGMFGEMGIGEAGSIEWPEPETAATYFDGTLIFALERADDALSFHFAAR